jgi:iron complex outermembrane recepter protein
MDDSRTTRRRAWRAIAAAMSFFLFWSISLADPKVNFNLPSDEFPKAILEFYHQSKIEVLFLASDSLSRIKTQPVEGEFEPREALDRMLKGTGLTYRFVTEHSVAIKQPDGTLTFAIDAGDAKRRLTEWSSLTHLQLLFKTTHVSGMKTQSVHGQFTPGDALKLMLRNGPLDCDEVNDKTWAVFLRPKTLPKSHQTSRQVVGRFALEQVTVTGTLIHDAGDISAPLVVVSPQDISLAPFDTVQDALYQLPIVSLNAPREDLGLNNNYNWGTGINLRSLGVGATLVLVNGHRQPMSGLDGDFVDVSNIPGAAIERIEVLPDGASAIYGSDAIAGVVNIILKDDFQGAQTQARYGGAPGGRDSTTVSQLLGTHWDTGKAMLAYEYLDATALPASARGYAANENKVPYGGGNYSSVYGDPGNVVSPTTLLPIYGITAGSHGAILTPAINYQNDYSGDQLFAQRTQNSVYGRGLQEMGGGVIELFAEGRFTDRRTYDQHVPQDNILQVPGNNPFNPTPGATTLVAYSFLNTLGPASFGAETRNYVGTVGANLKLAGGWLVTLSETYGREKLFENEYNIANQVALGIALADSKSLTAFNAFGGANNPTTLAAIRLDSPLHADSGIETTSLTADGPLFSLPAGDVRLAIGLERREESLEHTVPDLDGPSEYSTENASYSRHVQSAFTELSVPLIGDAQNQRAAPRLEFTMAGRYEDYSDYGHAFNPQFRLQFIPIDSLKLRASWGRSFRAPTLDDLYDSSQNAAFLTTLADPRSPTGQSTVLAFEGDNPHLRQETSKTWTAGFDLVPVGDPGLKFSLTYYSIDYTDQITIPDAANPLGILVQENEWAAVINRSPTPAQIAAVCNTPLFYGSRADCLASTPAAIVDYQLANLASTRVNGLDIDLHQTFDSDVGKFSLGATANEVFHFDQAVTESSGSVDILNTYSNPLKLRVRAIGSWDQRGSEAPGIGATVSFNFTNSYSNPGSTLQPRIDSLTTTDLQLRYHMAEGPGIFSGMEFTLNAVNVFNQSPPFADSVYGYDTANFQPLGRVLSLSVRKRW